MLAYRTLIEDRDADTRADIDAAIDGLPLPSKIREREQRNAQVREMAAQGLIEIG